MATGVCAPGVGGVTSRGGGGGALKGPGAAAAGHQEIVTSLPRRHFSPLALHHTIKQKMQTRAALVLLAAAALCCPRGAASDHVRHKRSIGTSNIYFLQKCQVKIQIYMKDDFIILNFTIMRLKKILKFFFLCGL
jgi:hypothetical protein